MKKQAASPCDTSLRAALPFGHRRLRLLGRSFLPLLVAAALQAVPASAIVYVMPTDESMVDRSPIIVFGEVLRAQPGTDPDSPTTDYLFSVEEVLKGFVAGSGIMVRQPGGVTDDGRYMRIMGLPMLAEGHRVLLFLRPEESGVHRIVEYGLGMFWEARLGDRDFLLREPSLQRAAPLSGRRSASDRVGQSGYRETGAFRHWIADRVQGVERPSDYFAAELFDGPTAVVQHFRLLQFCDGETLPARWREFDRGEGVGFEVQSGGQPGIREGGLSQVRAALRLWNVDSGSNVNLEFDGTVSQAPRLRVADGDNSITFEDPHDEIDGALLPGEGGTLALTGTWSTCGTGTVHSAGGLRAQEIPQANITTQNGFESYLRQFDSRTAERSFQNIIAHELGHALGIDHPCQPDETGCDRSHEYWGALMWPSDDPSRDLGTALHDDDRDAVRRLYPAATGSGGPDLVVESPRSTESFVAPGGAFRFGATVRNGGDGRSSATTLRYYRSSDSRITTSDTSVGTDSVGALSASATDRQSIGQRAPSTPGTYYYGACVDTVSGESDTTNNCSDGLPVTVGGAEDEVVETDFDLASDNTDPSGITYAQSRFYVVDRTDEKVYAYRGADGRRDAAADFDLHSGNTDPSGITYAQSRFHVVDRTDRKVYAYRGADGRRDATADFDLHSGNADPYGITYAQDRFYVVDRTDNKAYAYSMDGGDGGTTAPDLVVESPRSTESSVAPGGAFRFGATVRNSGDERSAATMLRYYRSSDSRITTSDTAIGSDRIGTLSASETDRQTIGLRAPATPGTYYYGACVDSVAGESNTGNNCSNVVRVTVNGDDPSVPALEGNIHECSGQRSGSFINARIAGTVRATRRVSSVTLEGYADGHLLGTRFLGSFTAGQSRSFSISGSFFDLTATTIRCEVSWTATRGGIASATSTASTGAVTDRR